MRKYHNDYSDESILRIKNAWIASEERRKKQVTTVDSMKKFQSKLKELQTPIIPT